MTNSRINRKKSLISIREMDKKATSWDQTQRLKTFCHAYGIDYILLSEMDEDTFLRAMSEEFNQVDQFFKK